MNREGEEKKIAVSGILIFSVGLGLLFFVFSLAYQVFEDPLLLSFIETSSTGGGEGIDLNRLFTGLVYVAVVFAALWVMGSVAGRIASKGIELFNSRKG